MSVMGKPDLKNWRRVVAHPVAKNMMSLYIVQLANIILPLLLIPYLARILLPKSFGVYLFFYSLSIWLYTVVEYGVNLSATREISCERDDKDCIAEIVVGVLGGQALITIGIVSLAAVAFCLVPFLHQNPVFLVLSLLFGIARGFGPLWYFCGKERMEVVAALEVAGRTLATLLAFPLVRSPDCGWVALALPSLTSMIVTLMQLYLMYREVEFRFPRRIASISMLKKGWSMFVYRFSGSLYTTANVVILGILTSPAMVGFYGGAEKITRGLLTLISPVINALYPRISYLVVHDPAKAWRAIRLSLLAFTVGGMFLGAVIAVYAPIWIGLLLGPGYDAAVPILRIMSLLAPLLPVSTAVSVLCMLSMGLEKKLSVIILSAGILNVILAVLLTKLWNGLGMAMAAVVTEIFVTFNMCLALRLVRVMFRDSTQGVS